MKKETDTICIANLTETELKVIGQDLAKAYGIKAVEPTRYNPVVPSVENIALQDPRANAVLRQIAAAEGVQLIGALPTGGMFESPNIQIARNIAAARAVKWCSER